MEHFHDRSHRMKPSELRTAFATAKARAARTPPPPRIIEFVNADDHTARVSSNVPLHKPLFEPTPVAVWIDEYTPFHTLTTKLTFRNCDSVARRFRIEAPSSPYFKVLPYSTNTTKTKDSQTQHPRVDSKIAAGMEIAFLLEFYPQEVKEMTFDIVCCTERERFALPVHVLGRIAALDIPDEIHFGQCPVKMTTSKVLTVHNIGTRTAKFAFNTNSIKFSISPPSAILTQHGAVQLELLATPQSNADGEGELMILDDAGQSCVVRLVSDVKNLDVYLSAPLVEPTATYISLSSRKTIKICNESEFPLDFAWKAFPDTQQEHVERSKLLAELDEMESAELENLSEVSTIDDVNELLPSSVSSPFDARRSVQMKYKHLRKAASEDPMQFVSDCFGLTPLTGRVWAHSEIDVVTTFSPTMALLYSCTAFLEIGGQANRLPLQLRGQGIGPKAKVVYNEFLDFGEVFINDERTRDFTIQNKGEIPAVYELISFDPPPPPGMIYRISPSTGTLAVNEMLKVVVTFSSSCLGDVFQLIRFRLQGNVEELCVRFKAKVVPPILQFDVDQLDFGVVSYSFVQTKTLKLINTSKIAMSYSIRIAEESNYKNKEFEIILPTTNGTKGYLEAYGEQEIIINFIPMTIKTYDYKLVVNVVGIESELLRLPIHAQSCVPEVVIQKSMLDFGSCYLRYPHKQTLWLENKSSHLLARYRIPPQDEHSRAIASYSAGDNGNDDATEGFIACGEKVAVEIALSCEKLGPIRLPMIITVIGSNDLPLSVTLTATGTGPHVELDQNAVNWGNATCLVDHERTLTMTNRSVIPASYKTFIKNARSKFQINCKEGVVAPGESVIFVLTANLDDTIVFKDQLHILINDGDNLVVPLSIKGTGTTMWSPTELRVVDFGYQMTSRECEWSCTLENKGKRSQLITWSNKTTQKRMQLLEEAQSVASKKNTNKMGPRKQPLTTEATTDDLVSTVFTVFPSTIELKPRTACVFVFKGFSSKPGVITEELLCETRVGKEKNSKVAFFTEVRGDFIDPKVESSAANGLVFEYIHRYPYLTDIPRQSQPLRLTNTCALPLTFTMRTQPPFSLDCWEAELEPNHSVDLNVEFYPGFKDDHMCRLLQNKVAIAYVNHPQRDTVDLIGDISFPNLSFETMKIDFGCTLNDTQKSMLVTITNVSKVDTSYRWIFIQDEIEAQANATTKRPYIPINQVFDILPIRGCLKPGETEQVEFLFYGHANRKFKSLVACEVEGGPEYELTLAGEASSLVYKLDKQCLDFGPILYNKAEDREFSILNIGKVPFTYTILAENITRGRYLVISPMNGKVAPNEKQRILVQLKPGIPETFEETLMIEIAHFQPVEFKLIGTGMFAAITMNLPRENHAATTIQGQHPNWRDLKRKAKIHLESSMLSASVLTNAMGMIASSDSKASISTGRTIQRTLETGSSGASIALQSVKQSPDKTKTIQSSSRTTIRTTGALPTVIDDLDIEIEACRAFFADYLVDQDRRKSILKGKSGELEQEESELRLANTVSAVDSVASIHNKKGTSRSSTSTITTLSTASTGGYKPESFPFVLSQFVLDFGNIVVGTHKIKRFSVINIGHTPASFQLDKNLAQSRGFQLEPERVVRLPEKQSVEFTVTFQARKNIELGLHQVQLPMVMKNGPPCLILIRATVTMPDISISMETLDFGCMAVGTSHTMYTQLHNVSSVNAEWALKKPLGSAKDEAHFKITPTGGNLAPGNKVNLEIQFIPEEGRHYALKLPIKVNANTKTRSITLRGEGADLRLSFEPSLVVLGPVLPCSAPTKQMVELRNDSAYPVEVFSLDFDPTYKDDEELLRALAVYDADEMLQLPIRVPGQSIREYLKDNGLLPKVDTSPTEVSAEGNGTDDTTIHVTDNEPRDEINTIISVPPPPQPRTGFDYIMTGPPRSGKSTQARLLAERDNLVVWTIDEAIQRLCLEPSDSALGRKVRVVLGIHEQESLQSITDSSKSMEVQSSTNNSEDVTDLEVEVQPPPSMVTLLPEIIEWRLSQPDVRQGSVLDGWENGFCPFEDTIRACALVMPTSRIICLQVDEDEYEAFVAHMTKDALETVETELPEVGVALESEETSEVLVGEVEPVVSSVEDELQLTRKKKVASLFTERKLLATTKSIQEYQQEMASMRHLLALFVARDRKTMTGMQQVVNHESAKEKNNSRVNLEEDDLAVTNQEERDVSPILPVSALESAQNILKSSSRADNFILDFNVTEGSAPLTIHTALCSIMEKYARELELSHLAIPLPIKHQLVRRPTQRFNRKTIARFSIMSCSVPPVDGDPESAPSFVSRWVIPARSSIPLLVHFQSEDVGAFDTTLGFEIMGIRREFSLFCRGTASVPQINADPRNVFMNRIKTRPDHVFVHKKFVVSRHQFEFGPLIVPAVAPKVPETEMDFQQWIQTSGTHNIEAFRISNTSKGPLHVDFTLENEQMKGVFSISPRFLDLNEGETKELHVWANPPMNGLHENTIVCCVRDNPEPVTFPISCYGCTPTLRLRGPWEQLAPDTTCDERPSSSSQSKSTHASIIVPSLESSPPVIDFERLLLTRQDEKIFSLENTSAVAISWRITSLDEIPSDFRILSVEGVIKPFQTVPITVMFRAINENVYKHTISLEYSDADSSFHIKDRIRSLSLIVQAEAYKIDVCSFENADAVVSSGSLTTMDGNLDFGIVRVGESQTRSFNIRNRGKYNIKFVFALRTTMARDLFRISPNEMILEPDKVANVQVTFQAKHQEVLLRDNKDIKCTIIEMVSGEACNEFHVLTTGKSVFSVFRVQPNRGINFGPLRFSDKPKTKRLEIRNDGVFPFKYRIHRADSTSGFSPLTLDTSLPVPSVLTIGQFSISPDCGSIDPGTTAALEVTFTPWNCELYREILQIEISGRNPNDLTEALQYELVGESCYPGISASDYESIFEEQIVVRSFGTEPSFKTDTTAPLAGLQPVVFAEKERVFSFGAIIISSKGCVERFKISNPTKVTTTVQFKISSGGDNREEIPSSVFTVQPSVWEIPPLEHRFVNVHFKPTAITTYSAVFHAHVEDSPENAHAMTETRLQFELRGDGTMPCITISEPTIRDATGALQLLFGRVRTSKAKTLPFVLRNDGILAATVLFSMQANSNFVFAHGNGSVVVAPHTSETLHIQFKPTKAHDELIYCDLKMTVQNNPFDETTIKLSGQGYREDLVFEDLPLGYDDQLHFDDIQVLNSALSTNVKVFSLCNQSNEATVRFAWPTTGLFSFSPSIGHLLPGAYKLITATFTPSETTPVVFDAHKIALQSQRIRLRDNESTQGWDDTMRAIHFDETTATSDEQLVVEPLHDLDDTPPAAISLICYAAADTLQYECDTPSIVFRRTFMLQVCTHKIKLWNKSKIRLPYTWRWTRHTSCDDNNMDSDLDSSCFIDVNSEDEDNPFEITPSAGDIPPDSTQIFILRFSPMEVDNYQYTLVLDIPGSSSSLRVPVSGSSLRPACHFDVERSDYAQRRAPHLPGPMGELGPLDPSVRILEMESLGVRVRNTRRFYVVNPTNVSYEFSWIPEGENNSCFRCVTPKGLMLAGKRCEMIFEFTPQQLELQEMFWRFRIEQYQVNQLFLLVGTTTEPRVTLDRGSVNFNTLLIGTKTLQTVALVNPEHIPFHFVFDKTSLDYAGEILVHPLSGVIPPHGRCSIEIEFIPSEEKLYNINLNCIIKRKPTRLSLNIKGEGYNIHDALTIAAHHDPTEISHAIVGITNALEFGTVRINEVISRTVIIHNMGKFNFEFNWTSLMNLPPFLSIEPLQGTVKKNDKITCRITFSPTKATSLDVLGLFTCTVAGARHYPFSLHGSALPPSLQFSFTSFDFGACFIADSDAQILQSECTTLTIFNLDSEASVDLDCNFEKKSHLRVDCPPCVLGPRESLSIPITFTARQEVSYLEVIPFLINGSTTVSVSIRGEGVAPKIELGNASMQTIAFGSLRIGQQLTRSVKVINRGKRKTPFQLLTMDNEGEHMSLSALGISIFPADELALKVKESADIELRFSPTHLIPSFTRDVYIRVAGSRKKLLTVTGCCQGVDVQLEIDTLSFGTVCLGSQLIRKVHLQNRGDIAAKFQWNARAFAPDFTITPLEGVIAPNLHKTLEVTFKPSALNPDIRYDRLCCLIEGADPVFLTLVGASVKQAASSIQDVHFDSKVREETTKTIVIENKSRLPWNLIPVVQGDHWSCVDNIAVPADGKATLAITYYPLTMTKQSGDEEKINNLRPDQHQGSIFFAIPDGTALLYNLFGKASAPSLAGELRFSTPAKKSLPITIAIPNWLKTSQTFNVEIKKANELDLSVLAQGSTSLIVQASSTRNYHLKFFSYTEGQVSLSVRFVNPVNGEFLLYTIQVTVTRAAEVETIQLEAPVRQSIRKTIIIENPFGIDRQISFVDKDKWWKCTSPYVQVRQLADINGRSEGTYEIEYRPTVHVENTVVEAIVTIAFIELGEYSYKLILTTQPAGVERVLQFKVPIGGSQMQTFSYTTYSDVNTSMKCNVQQPAFFSIAPSVDVEGTPNWEGRVQNVNVTFEPEELGEIRDTLVLSSSTVGEYKCSLHGIAVPPLPQGPFVFPVSGSRDIEFKNVFSTPREFEFVVDNPKFILSTKNMTIAAKTSKMITIKFDSSGAIAAPANTPIAEVSKGGKGTKGVVTNVSVPTAPVGGAGAIAATSLTGKLFVSCASMKDLPPWVYYLEGPNLS